MMFLSNGSNEVITTVEHREAWAIYIVLRANSNHEGKGTADHNIITTCITTREQYGRCVFWRIGRGHRSFGSQRLSSSLAC
jgi:hypothetical protein